MEWEWEDFLCRDGWNGNGNEICGMGGDGYNLCLQDSLVLFVKLGATFDSLSKLLLYTCKL